MFSPRRRRLTALALVLGLGCYTPTSSHALLTELFVGGTVLMQVLGIVGEALPQVAALAGSVAALVKSGEDTAGTIGRIVDIFLPGRKNRKKQARKPEQESTSKAGAGASGGREAPSSFDLPDLAAPPRDLPEGEADLEEEAVEDEGVGTSLTRLLEIHDRREAVVRALEVANEEQRKPLGHGLLELTKLYEAAVDVNIQELREAARKGDRKAISRFRVEVEELPEARRAAVEPVLEQLLGRGEQFRSLYEGEAEDREQEARALAPLESLMSRRSRRRRAHRR